MMEKLTNNLLEIESGDVIVCRGNKLISKAISILDDSYWTHVGVLEWDDDTLYIIDSNGDGVKRRPLADRIHRYEDIRVIRLKKTIFPVEYGIQSLKKAMQSSKGYDFLLILSLGIERILKREISLLDHRKRFICSELVAERFVRPLVPFSYALETPKAFIKSNLFKKIF